ncbi:hypothetical protein [uncultured Tenacibaculum sp.]|uniref:hypothetical protein n=1 Tax=uncultured Tenacibaculum sp. TaxID=174713 RepID=UPI002601957B|nr:hypothetical protein [uncultured Tenacibaculum sp.]
MIKINTYFNRFNFVLVPLLLVVSLIVLSTSSLYKISLAPYIIIDFLFTIPFVYFLLIRKKEIHKITVLSVFVLGVLLSSLLIPEENQGILLPIKSYLVPILELGIFSVLVIKARKLYKEFKNSSAGSFDFFEAITTASKELLPSKIASFLATEITVFYYVFFNWRSREEQKNEYSYHKEGTYNGVLIGVMLVILIETFVLHVLVEKWSLTFAWIISGLSIYTLLQFLAIFKSLRSRPVFIDEENRKLLLRFSFLGTAEVEIDNIKSITLSNGNDANEINHLAFIGGLTSHNILIEFKEAVSYKQFYGLQKTTTKLGVLIDNKEAFVAHVKTML